MIQKANRMTLVLIFKKVRIYIITINVDEN